jgi:hypothetical protein
MDKKKHSVDTFANSPINLPTDHPKAEDRFQSRAEYNTGPASAALRKSDSQISILQETVDNAVTGTKSQEEEMKKQESKDDTDLSALKNKLKALESLP